MTLFNICDKRPALYDSTVREKAMQNPVYAVLDSWRPNLCLCYLCGISTAMQISQFPRSFICERFTRMYSQDRSAYFAAAK
jgi:hypothetical protein